MTLDWEDGVSGFVSAGGASLEFSCFGSGDGPVLVLLHEGLGCVAMWRDFPIRLAEATGCRVFAYSRAGYGRSDAATLPRPLDVMTREAVEVLPQVLDFIDAEQLILVGHSDGATIAAEYAGRVDDIRVRGLVLMAPHFYRETVTEAEIARIVARFDQAFADRLGKYHKDPASTFSGWADVWLAPAFADWDVSAVIKNIRVPVLGIQGAEDQYGTLTHLDALEAQLSSPFDRLVLPGCRHSPHADCPEAVLSAVKNFTVKLRS